MLELRKNTLFYRLMCLLMAGLTACSSGRTQYVWHDLGPQPMTGKTKGAEIQENWGAKPEGPDVSDPVIAPGFLLNLTCPDDPKLTGDFRVDFNGDLQMPYNITLNTSDQTLSQLKQKLVDRLHAYFKNPISIDIRIKERHYWIDVRGLVDKPGRYLVEPQASLDMVIGMAGGTNKLSAPLYVRIQKGSKIFFFDLNQYYSQGEEHPQILGWLGGEIIFFQKEGPGSLGDRTSQYHQPIYMLGEVKKPGDFTLTPGSDFVDLITEAGGFNSTADLKRIEIIRRTGGRKRVYDFSWDEFQRAPTPQQGDIVFVRADVPNSSERKIGLAALIISAMATVLTSTVLVLDYHQRNK